MTASEFSTESDRIAEGRVRHGVGLSPNFPGNVSHLVSPVVGFLRLRQRDNEPLTTDDFDWFIDRLGLVLDMARHEAEQSIRPGGGSDE